VKHLILLFKYLSAVCALLFFWALYIGLGLVSSGEAIIAFTIVLFVILYIVSRRVRELVNRILVIIAIILLIISIALLTRTNKLVSKMLKSVLG